MSTLSNSITGSESVTVTDNRSGLNRFYELVGALLMTGLLVWFVYYLVNPTTLPIRQVRIEGEFRHLSTEGLQELVQNRVRGGFFSINVNTVRDAVMTEPWVSNVSVHRVWPDGLQVVVSEQVAVARWQDNGLLNRDGDLFTPAQSTFPGGLPLLSGPAGSHHLMMQRYLLLERRMTEAGLAISELLLDDRRAWSIRLDNGVNVVIGRRDFEQRITRFLEVIPSRLGTGLDAVRQIDMRYTNGFAVRWMQDSSETPTAGGA